MGFAFPAWAAGQLAPKAVRADRFVYQVASHHRGVPVSDPEQANFLFARYPPRASTSVSAARPGRMCPPRPTDSDHRGKSRFGDYALMCIAQCCRRQVRIMAGVSSPVFERADWSGIITLQPSRASNEHPSTATIAAVASYILSRRKRLRSPNYWAGSIRSKAPSSSSVST
jgi:hypothetical protein